MALLTWSSTYSVSVKEIDEQHKKLIDLINFLHDSMKEGKGKEAIGTVLNELANYTVFHFNYEEALMRKYNYAKLSEHKKEHDFLVIQVKQLIEDLKNGKQVLSIELMNFLKEWLIKHILNTDKQLTLFLNSNGVN